MIFTKAPSLIGATFGRLTVLKQAASDRDGNSRWLCLCRCGNEKVITRSQLRKGTQSCGCLNREVCAHNRTTHGKAGTQLYTIWNAMLQRCSNKNRADAHNYVLRGISVCDEWKADFPAFSKWAADNGYRPGLTIDRRDNSGNYGPDNCRFVSRRIQANNMRANRIVEYNGAEFTMADLSRHTGIPYGTLRSRIGSGWAINRAVSAPVRPIHARKS